MHKWAYEIMEKVKENVSEIGIDNFCGQKLDDLKDFCEIAKCISEMDYYYNIIDAMEKSEYGVDYDVRGRITKSSDDGKMYYTEMKEHKTELARQSFLDGKMNHNSGSSEDNTANMKNLEEMANCLAEDFEEMIPEMNQAEIMFLRQRLNNLVGML